MRELELTVPGPGAQTTSESVERSQAETANCTPPAATAMAPIATLPASGSAIVFVFPRLVRLLIILPRSILLEAVPQEIIINFKRCRAGLEVVRHRLTLDLVHCEPPPEFLSLTLRP